MIKKIENRKYICTVDGFLGRMGKHSALCGRVSLYLSKCMAHGNKKCIHKVKQDLAIQEEACRVVQKRI